MGKVILLGSFAESLINFRGPLLKEMTELGHSVIACAPDAPDIILKSLIKMRVEYRAIPFSRTGISPIRDIRVINTLVSLFRTERPDIVLSYTIKPVLYGSLAARVAGVPRIYSIITGLGYAFSGGSFKHKVVGFITRFLYKKNLRFNKKIFFQNPDDAKLFEETLTGLSLYVLLPNPHEQMGHKKRCTPLPQPSFYSSSILRQLV